MPVRRIAEDQPESFEFTTRNLVWARAKMADYPLAQMASAVVPILWRAQEQHQGWLPEPAIRCVADLTGVSYLRVFEVATFYTMFRLEPVGRAAHIEVAIPAAGADKATDAVLEILRERVSAEPNVPSKDGRFSWAMVSYPAPASPGATLMIGPDTHTGVTPAKLTAMLDGLEESVPAAAPAKPQPAAKKPADAAPKKAAPPAAKPASSKPASTPPPTKAPSTPPPSKAAKPPAPKAAKPPAPAVEPPPPPKPELAAAADAAGTRPPAVSASAVKADDLRKIRGVGPVIEQTLHDLGIFTYAQIAAWNADEKAWVNTYLAFKGRIDRERWVEQATELQTSEG